jgi:phage gpG-like protein
MFGIVSATGRRQQSGADRRDPFHSHYNARRCGGAGLQSFSDAKDLVRATGWSSPCHDSAAVQMHPAFVAAKTRRRFGSWQSFQDEALTGRLWPAEEDMRALSGLVRMFAGEVPLGGMTGRRREWMIQSLHSVSLSRIFRCMVLPHDISNGRNAPSAGTASQQYQKR